MDSGARSLSTGQGIGQAGSPWEALRAVWGQWTQATTITTGQKGALACLTLVGALDKRIAKEVKAQAQAFAAQEGAGWAIDLSGVTSWDSEGLAALVHALDVSELAHKQLTVLNPTAALRQTLEKAQLHRLFNIDTTD
jgi:anti-anti-sigma factor